MLNETHLLLPTAYLQYPRIILKAPCLTGFWPYHPKSFLARPARDNDRISFWEKGKNLIGQTIKVEFDSRQPPKNGVYSLRFPEFKGLADKESSECIAQEDWPPKE